MSFPGRLYLIFSPEQCRHDPWETLAAALAGGVDLVQWRHPVEDRSGLLQCRDLCRAHGVPVLVNDHVMLALRNGVAGAHVGQQDLPIPAARKLLVGQWLGVSTHDVAQIHDAAAQGADYIGFGPCHPTTTKGYATGKTPAEIEAAVLAAAAHRLPLFAIGGITATNTLALRSLGVDRIAVAGDILRAADPQAAAAALRRLV